MRSLKKIISGGQTGADRAALDWAIAHEVEHGGWCPRGRRAEDGVLDHRYHLRESESANYRQRTRLNVQDSDGSLIVNLGALEGGTLETLRFAERLQRHRLVVQMEAGINSEDVSRILAWLRHEPIRVLNIAGPRESKRPGIYQATLSLLDALDTADDQ